MRSFAAAHHLFLGMARLARVVVPGCPHHVTQRGNMRRDVFLTPVDRQVYLKLLRQYSALYSLRILGYCLMSNHVHLVVVPADSVSMARALRALTGRYAQYRNARDATSGHVWQSRYYSCPFEPGRMAAVMRYVELNPVRAGLMRSPGDYSWSSAIGHLGGADAAGVLDLAWWVRDWPPDSWDAVLREGREESPAIRQATHAGRPWGTAEFLTMLEGRLARRLSPARPGPMRRDLIGELPAN